MVIIHVSTPVISHLITARDSLLQVWEVREREAEGKATATLHHILTRRLHGTVTSLSRVRTLASKLDGADRVLISFMDAKMSLMEWTPSAHELLPISLHTYEKLPQVVDGLTKLATDPASRLSVLLLPTNTGGDATLAILPFFQEEIDLESLGVDSDAWGNDGVASLPYAPSHLLPLASLTSSQASSAGPSRSSTLNNAPSAGGTLPVRNVIDMVFLPGFNEPTLALLYAPEPTWAGRLENVSSNCLVSLVTLATGASQPGSSTSGATTAVVIATSPALPHSSLAVYPCPPDLGGTLIVTANGVLHLEQSGKVIGTPANAWFGKEWFGSGGRTTGTTQAETTVREGLEGSRVVFIANDKAIVFCKSGSILELVLQTSGRSVSSMKLDKVAGGTPASCVERIRGSVGRFGEQGYVFVGSEVGESALVSWEIGNAGASAGTAREVLHAEDDEMDLDEDQDLYGTTTTSSARLAQQPSATRFTTTGRSLALVNCDTIDSYGAIRSMAVGLVGDDSPPELVACTGAGSTSGFTIFHRSLPPRKKRRIDLDSAAIRGIWSLPVRRSEGRNESSDSVLVTSDGARTKMTSQVGGTTSPDVETDDATISMSAVSGGALIVRVTSTHVLLLTPDLVTVDSLAVDGLLNALRATASDRYILIVGKERAQLVFVDSELRKLGLGALPDRFVDKLGSATLFLDTNDVVPLVASAAVDGKPAPAPGAQTALEEPEDDLYTTAPRRSLASDQDSDRTRVILPTAETGASLAQGDGAGGLAWQWLVFVDDQGALDILLLPSMEVVFSTSAIALFPDVLEDGGSIDILNSIDPDDVKIDRVVCVGIGAKAVRPHLLVLLANGAFAAYEAFPCVDVPTSRKASLGVRFVKVLTRRLSMPIARRGRNAVAGDDESPPARREFVPFAGFGAYSGVFVTGEDPFWLVASDHGPVRLFDHGEKGVYSFSPIFFTAADAHYIVQSKTGTSIASLPSDMCLDRELPYARAPRDRRYGTLTFDLDSGLYVAGTLFDTVFMNFDEDGQPVFTNDSPDLIQPHNYRSTLELLTPGNWQAIHGYEFRPNEFISTVKSVSLATQSTASGRKDFIAVGTTVYRAEDLAARGGIYVFEVVKIVPNPETPTHDHQLKLLFFEDTKSVVGNVCDLDGYLVMSMGQKLYVRALEQDEVLLAVGFLDVGVHVTSLQSMKNFLLIGDALQSVTLVVFQEDPYKLVLLGRDYRPARTSTANFLVNDGKVSFIAGDVNGVLRLFEYDPTNIASHAGQRLLCRTEYNAGTEAVASLLYAKRTGVDDPKQNGILYGGVNGSLYTLAPHFGGLNPRGHRIVKNDTVSRAISKGVLDGELLAEFEGLPLDRQLELTAQIGTDPDTVLLNLRNMQW